MNATHFTRESRAEFTTTRSGITIGAHYIPPAAPLTADQEAIQRTLLAKKKRNDKVDRVTVVTCLAALAAFAALSFLG